MRVLIAYPMAPEAEALLGRDGVHYQPELGTAGAGDMIRAIAECRPDAIIAGQAPSIEVLGVWKSSSPDQNLVLVLTGDGVDRNAPAGIAVQVVAAGPDHLAPLHAAERMYNHLASAVSRAVIHSHGTGTGQGTVAVVGAGIVGLVTALRLVEGGYRVKVLDACPDPRLSCDWRTLGCTNGGDNARMFTFTEADNYNDQDGSGRAARLFRDPVSNCGWRICSQESMGPIERGWVDAHERVSPWQARAFNADIFAVNRESGGLWSALRRRLPALFEDVEIHDGILRLYTDPIQLDRTIARHRRFAILHAALRPLELAASYPVLADACRSGLIAGGLEVPGFTVNVHRFVARLLAALEKKGVSFSWDCRVEGLVRDGRGRVGGLQTGSGTIRADHYAVSPGVYGSQLLAETASGPLIQGVLGVWMTLPNLNPKLNTSLKVSRKGHMAEDANVTVARDDRGRDILLWGSGYGYTGRRPDNILGDELGALYRAVEENVREFFPKAYTSAVKTGLLAASRRLCVRPWTPTGLGVLEVIPATDGLLVIAGGHNTGGFTQSPSVAEAVLAAIEGRSHPMHELYHPGRSAFPSAVPGLGSGDPGGAGLDASAAIVPI